MKKKIEVDWTKEEPSINGGLLTITKKEFEAQIYVVHSLNQAHSCEKLNPAQILIVSIVCVLHFIIIDIFIQVKMQL